MNFSEFYIFSSNRIRFEKWTLSYYLRDEIKLLTFSFICFGFSYLENNKIWNCLHSRQAFSMSFIFFLNPNHRQKETRSIQCGLRIFSRTKHKSDWMNCIINHSTRELHCTHAISTLIHCVKSAMTYAVCVCVFFSICN